MNKKFGVVLVGCGYMGAAHMDEIYYRDKVEIRGVVDVDKDKAQEGRIKIIYCKDRQTHQEEGDLIEYYNYSENNYGIINNEAQRKSTWDQLQYLMRMVEEGIDAVPTIDEVFEILKIALQADRAVTTGERIEL